MDARPGDVLAGKFRVERTIGTGGMGTVLEATDTVLGRRVAIKLTNDVVAADPSASARFVREARAMAALRGTGFVRVFEVGTLDRGDRHVPFLVMELLEGEDLRTRLGRIGPLAADELVDLFTQICEALAEAHATGLVHRDIKPSNLFVETRADGRLVVRVLDLGISKPADDPTGQVLTASSGTLGSPRYMSPEQALDPREVDARSDIWSLGVSMYELWTGKPPFEGPSHLKLCKAILETEPASPRSLRAGTPPALEAIILRCLRKRPQDRFADVADLAEALAAIDDSHRQRAISARALAGRRAPTSSRSVSDTAVDATPRRAGPDQTETSTPVSRSTPSIPPPPRSHRGAIAGASAVVAVAVLGVGGLWAFGNEDTNAVSSRVPSTFVGTKRALVNTAAATRDTPVQSPSTTTATEPKVKPVLHKPPARDDDPLSSSH